MNWKDEEKKKPDNRPQCKRCYRPMQILFHTDYYCPHCEKDQPKSTRNDTIEIDYDAEIKKGTATTELDLDQWHMWPGLCLDTMRSGEIIELDWEHWKKQSAEDILDFLTACIENGITVDQDERTNNILLTK